MKQAYMCEIVRNTCIAPDIYDMRFVCAEMAAASQPGQFVHIKCGDDINTLLRRPISICDIDGNQVRVLYQVKGEGTKLLAQKKKGEQLDVMGPLGRGFQISADNKKCAVIGGGIGTFPLLLLSKQLDKPDVYLGFRTKELVSLEEEFAACAGNLTIATDDGSYGYNGFAIDALKANLDGVDMIYACGPTPMLKAVQALSAETGIEAQLSLEQRMGCGIGACLTCACNVRGHYAHVCKAGPVFKASEVTFDD